MTPEEKNEGLCAEAARKIDYDKPEIPFLNSGYSKDRKNIYYELAVLKEQIIQGFGIPAEFLKD